MFKARYGQYYVIAGISKSSTKIWSTCKNTIDVDEFQISLRTSFNSGKSFHVRWFDPEFFLPISVLKISKMHPEKREKLIAEIDARNEGKTDPSMSI